MQLTKNGEVGLLLGIAMASLLAYWWLIWKVLLPRYRAARLSRARRRSFKDEYPEYVALHQERVKTYDPSQGTIMGLVYFACLANLDAKENSFLPSVNHLTAMLYGAIQKKELKAFHGVTLIPWEEYIALPPKLQAQEYVDGYLRLDRSDYMAISVYDGIDWLVSKGYPAGKRLQGKIPAQDSEPLKAVSPIAQDAAMMVELTKREQTTYDNLVRGLLEMMLEAGPSGNTRSGFKDQTAILEGLVARNPSTPGLSKRNLEKLFGRANQPRL